MSSRISKGYWIWGQFDANATDLITSLYQEINNKLNGPNFDIHLTISGPFNYDEEKQLHYVNTSIGFMKGANRFQIGYGKKRAGIFCVGGVCKEVPSSNGFSLNISSNF